MILSSKSISFTREYEREFNYFMTQANKSKYVCELIRKDLEGGGRGLTKEDIENLIDEKLKNISISKNVEDLDNRDIRENLMGLFGDI